jgi:DNA helicase-2/ATP-dependent DNA helicase PcrA
MNYDKDQLDAINHNGSVVLGALPGSGKTSTMIGRIKKNIAEGKRSLALTFTKCAAREIQKRLNDKSGLVVSGTMHSVCLDALRSNGEKRGIIDSSSRSTIVKHICDKLELEKDVVEDALADYYENMNMINRRNKDIAAIYEEELLRINSIDFSLMLHLFINDKKIRLPFKVDELMVDEFQDINVAQQCVIDKIIRQDPNCSIFFVGDTNQCIYQWRYADPSIMNSYTTGTNTIRGCVVKWLHNNYRSARDIIRFSNYISPNGEQMKCTQQEKGSVTLYNNSIDVREINDYKGTKGVLCRTSQELKSIERLLFSRGIPYKVINMSSVLDSLEVKDILAMMQLCNCIDNCVHWKNRSKKLI